MKVNEIIPVPKPSFLSTLASLGTFQSRRPPPRNADPVKRARQLFERGVRKQLASVEAGDFSKKGGWVIARGGKYQVSLRYGLVPMPLNGDATWLEVDTIENVRRMLIGAVEATNSGEFDDTFKAMARPPKGKRNV